MVKVRIIPNGEVSMPGSEKPMPADGVVTELTTYWQRLAETGTVRIAHDADAATSRKSGGKKGR